jgi:hypothetical protein
MRLLVVAETFIPSGSDHRYLAHGERKGLFLPRPAGVTGVAGRRLSALPPGPEPAHRLTPDILHLRIARGAQASR